MNEQKLRRAFMFTACFIVVRLGVGSGEKCGGRFYRALSLFDITFVVNVMGDSCIIIIEC